MLGKMNIYHCFVIGYLISCVAVATVTQEEDYDDDYDEDYLELNTTANGTLQFTRELTNVTRDPGKMVKLICEVKNLDNSTDSKVTFKWLKFSVPVVPDKRITIKRFEKTEHKLYKSVLKITNLEVMDKAFYECIASNKIDKIKSQGLLNISHERWGTVSSDLPVYKPIFEHTDSSSGNLGDMTTFVPNSYSKTGDEFISSITNPVLPKVNEEAASSSLSFEKTMSSHTNLLSYNASEKFCQRYKGSRCKDFLENRYVFIQPPYSQDAIEAKVENAFVVISQSQDISSSCNKYAFPSLCFSAFPLCIDPQQSNRYQEQYLNKYNKLTEKDRKTLKDVKNKLALQRICKEDCKLLETELCGKEYAIAKRHPVIGQILELEECQYLPEETEENSRNCLKLGIDRSQNVNKDDNCYWDDGRLYRGIVDSSMSGHKCLRWSHQFHIPLSEHPELMAHNYCRNPDGEERQPFCFIEQNKREICAIRKCVHILAIYVGAILVGLIALSCSVIIFLCVRRRNRSTKNLQNMSIPTADKNIYGNPGPNSPMELNTLLPPNIPPQRNHHSNKNSYQNVPQYTYKEVSFIEELGEGAFGKVYKGELKTKSGKVFVAVKSLKENASAKTQADFQREIELISELKHPNIICLLGVVTKQEPMCMLFEFMSEGDLHEFLIANSPNEGKTLTQTQFLHIAIQIAQGMEYLSENHYVHRDLAARNCLVSKDLVVKISDFGLSRDMYSCDYYRVQSKSLLPVRWMPPESILYGKFTTESDVWSYGVVLWEIYSYGLQPYYGYNNQEVINMIRSRKLLPCPEACPSYCYSLMVECWAELAVRRPSFAEISHRLRVWKTNGNTAGAYFKTPEVYTNPQKFGHSSKSSHTTDSQTLCPTFDLQTDPWDQSLKKTSSKKLNDSQSSLTSRSSSLGNKTQSTNLSNEHNARNSNRKSAERRKRHEGSLDRKNIVVSSNGDNFESKLTH